MLCLKGAQFIARYLRPLMALQIVELGELFKRCNWHKLPMSCDNFSWQRDGNYENGHGNWGKWKTVSCESDDSTDA